MPELFIDHRNADDIREQTYPSGLTGCYARVTAFGEIPYASKLTDTMDLMTDDQIRQAIKDNDAADTWLDTLVQSHKIPTTYQNGLGYCWLYTGAVATMTIRAKQNEPMVELLPESGGGAVGWRNEGGTLDQSLAEARKGFAAISFAPDHGWVGSGFRTRCDPSKFAAGWEADRANHKVEEWFDADVPGEVWRAQLTLACRGVCISGGLRWWGHALTSGYRVRENGRGNFELKFWNSHGPSFGENGFCWFDKSKGTYDLGAFAPRAVTASER